MPIQDDDGVTGWQPGVTLRDRSGTETDLHCRSREKGLNDILGLVADGLISTQYPNLD